MEAIKKRRIAEAGECIKKAESHLKTSLLKMKLKPDYDSAAIEYDRAAVCYKNAGELQLCRDAYLKAANMHQQNGNLFHAAKCNENAGMICKELNDTDGAMKYMTMAADGYAESGSGDTSAMALDKAAKCLEDTDPDKAIQIYNKALAMVQQTDRARTAGDLMSRMTKLYLKFGKYTEAVNVINDEIEMYMDVKESGRVGQLTVGLVLVQLARGDSVAAEQSTVNSYKCAGFEFSEEANVCKALISAFESGDNAHFQQVLQQPLLKTMDNEFLRLMKTLKLQENEGHPVEGDDDEDLR